MRSFIRNLIGGLVVSLSLSPVVAEELSIRVLDDSTRVVLFFGKVEQGSSARLEELLVLNPDINRIAMASPGGSASEGFLLAGVLSRHKMTALIPEGTACLSACAIGFLGAEVYLVKGALGFHNMYIDPEDSASIPDLSLLIIGQSFGTHTAVFFLANGFKVELPVLISRHTSPETFVVFTSTKDLMTFFARSETDTVTEYLESSGVDQGWLDEHLWGPQKFLVFFGGAAQ